MNLNEIRAEYEDFDRIISDFGREIGNFSSSMYAKSGEVLETVLRLGNEWKGNGYLDFRNNMENKVHSIQSSLDKCDGLKLVLDELSVEIGIELAKLREKN